MRSIRQRLKSVEKRVGHLQLDPLDKPILEYDGSIPDLDLDELLEEHRKKYPNTEGMIFCIPMTEEGPQ